MKWSIQELFLGYKEQFNGSFFTKVKRSPVSLYRCIKYTFYWIFDGYWPTSWWKTDHIIYEIQYQRINDFKKKKIKKGYGFSMTLVYDLMKEYELNEDQITEEMLKEKTERLCDRLLYLIETILKDDGRSTVEEIESATKEFHELMIKYSYTLWD